MIYLVANQVDRSVFIKSFTKSCCDGVSGIPLTPFRQASYALKAFDMKKKAEKEAAKSSETTESTD